MKGRLSIAILIAANLLPLFGVLFWEWDLFLVLLLFWAENVIIGIFGIARLIVSRVSESVEEGLVLPVFFLVHYGGFMFGHFMVLFSLYSDAFEANAGVAAKPSDYYGILIENLNWVVVVALFISHGWSFIENFMGKREHERLAPGQAMALPYRRMFITHIALIAGGFFLVEKGQPLGGLVLLIAMKIVLDIVFHRREHARLAPQS